MLAKMVKWEEIPAEEIAAGDYIRLLIRGEWHERYVMQTTRKKTTIAIRFLGHPNSMEFSHHQKVKVEANES